METTSTDSFDNPSPELHRTLDLLHDLVHLSISARAAREFRAEIELLRGRHARLRLFDQIEIIDQTIPAIESELIKARSKASTAFMALDARDRQGIRIFYREDLKTFLRVRYADDPPNHTSQTFQAAQATRKRAIELAHMVSRDRLHWFRNNMPRSVLEDHDIAERLQRHAAEADKMEVDQITAGRELQMRFRALTRDDQFLFLRWYQADLAANGIYWDTSKHAFKYVGVQTSLLSARSDPSDV